MRITRTLATWMSRRQFPAVAAIVALALTLPALWTGWQVDDYLHRHVLLGSPSLPTMRVSPLDLFALLDGDPQRTARLMDIGVLPWWTYEHLRVAFWRPFSALTHWLDYQLWPNSPLLMHAHSLVWLALIVLLAGTLYRRLIGATWIAGLAGLLFAIDDAHALPAAWIANRNALLAAALGLLTLLAHDRWRRDHWWPGPWLAPLTLLLALLAGESAIGTAAYLFAYACFVDPAPWRRRLATLLPYAAVTLAWSICYHALGYGASGSGPYNDPTQDPAGFAALVLQRAPLLLMGQLGVPSADVSLIVSASVLRALWWWALILLTLLSITFLPLVRHKLSARFFVTGMLLSALPLCSVFPTDRVLLFVGFGAMGLLAQFLGGLREHTRWCPNQRGWRVLARLAAVFLIAVHAVLAPLVLPLQTWLPVLMGRALTQAADTLPDDPTIASQQLIIVNPPNAFSAAYVPILRSLNGLPTPTHIRTLAPTGQTVELQRTDPHTLIVRPELGFLPPPGTPTANSRHPNIDFVYAHQRLDRLFRGEQHRMRLGHRVEVTGVSIEVTALTDDGRPSEVAFRFSVPLEDPALRWVRSERNRYLPFTPPAVGDTVRLE